MIIMEVLTLDTLKMQQQEINGIDGILHTLWKKKLLNDFDCRIIASSNMLVEKKAAVYTAIMSKSKDEAVILTDSFRKMTVAIHDEQKSLSMQNDIDINNEGNNYTVLIPKNPFLIVPIITHLFGFLPLKDIKQSRLVCREWNSSAELCLRKRSAVHFRRSVITPRTFMEVSKYSFPEAPFPSFVFSNDEEDNKSHWSTSTIQDFFEKYGKNIKELKFNHVTITTEDNLTSFRTPYYDLTPLFISPSNITSLIIRCTNEYGREKTRFDITLGKFVSLKTLSLQDCRLIVSAENQSTRIAPLNVYFRNVCIMQNGKTASNLRCNDLVDFSKTLNISLCDYSLMNMGQIFDMGKQVFNVKQLHLNHSKIENWSLAKGEVEFLNLHIISFVERNHLKIKRLQTKFSKIDLATLPETLEIFICEASTISCSGEFYLPNLKYLSLPGLNIESLAYFSNCPLLELEILSYLYTLNLSLVPKSVKRLKMEPLQLKFTDDSILELETLILGGCFVNSSLKYCKTIIAQIKAKVFVVDYESGWDVDTSRVLQLVLANRQSEKIIIGLNSDMYNKTPFEGSKLSKYVDEKSDYYQFENNFGKSITKTLFEGFTKMNCYCDFDFFNQKL